MTLPLLVLLLGATPGGPAASQRFASSARTESTSAVDSSAAQRFGWFFALVRPLTVDLEVGPRAAFGTGFAEGSAAIAAWRAFEEAVRPPLEKAHELAAATRWIDALPVSVETRRGGVCLGVRLRGP